MSSAAYIDKFLAKFVRRINPPDWPTPGTDEYDDFRDDWIDALDRRNVQEHEADAALRRLREDPPQWMREHLPKLIGAIEASRRDATSTAAATDRDAAFEASRGCQHCGGSGMATLFRRGYEGSAVKVWHDHDGRERRTPMRVAAHCSCPMGRWARSKTRDLDTLSRVPDLCLILAGSRQWLASDPAEIPADVRPMTPQQARARVNEVFAKV